MLALLLTVAMADFDGGYTYTTDSGYGCYIGYGCDSCVRCDDLDCEMAEQAAGNELECRVGDSKTGYSVWCDCGGGGDTDTDTDTDTDVDTDTDTDTDPTGDDDDDDDTGSGDGDKSSSCGCNAAAVQSPVAVFGLLALLSGGMLMRRRR